MGMQYSAQDQLDAQGALEKFLASSSPEEISGGRTHTTWKITFSEKNYLIKRFSENAYGVEHTNTHAHYLKTQAIALELFRRKIPTVPAIITQENYQVFPFVPGKPLSIDTVTTQSVQKIAKVLAQMHDANLSISLEREANRNFTFQEKGLQAIAIQNPALHEKILAIAPLKKQVHEAYQTHDFERDLIICHGDLDTTNVIWDSEQQPHLIDWDLAGNKNRSCDLVTTAVCWSLKEDMRVDHQRFYAFIESYQQHTVLPTDGVPLSIARYDILNDWTRWLDFNIMRFESDAERSTQEIEGTLAGLPQLYDSLNQLF